MRLRFRHLGIVERLIYAVLCSIWLYAYFSPMQRLGLLNNAPTFLPVLAVLAVGFLLPRWWVQLIAAVVVSFGYVDVHWRPAGDSLVTGLGAVSSILWEQLRAAVHRTGFADPLQTFTFLLGVAVVFWLVTYASYRSRLWLFYNILGVAVLAVIDGNTRVHPNRSIVELVVIWIVILGLNQLRRMHHFTSPNSQPFLRFISPLGLLLVLCSFAGIATPKAAASWPNPFGASTGGNGTLKTIGYQLNNSRLGGSFVSNDQEVLQVVSPFPTYLRGETLSTYTGKGWKSAPLTDAQMLKGTVGVPFSKTVLASYTFHGLPTKTISQQISLETNTVNTSDLLGGYAIAAVTKLPNTYKNRIYTDVIQGNIQAPKLSLGQSYDVQSVVLNDPYKHLVTGKTPYAALQGDIPSAIQRYDLQLPGELPSKVGQLAKRIVAQHHATTEYQMVQALVSYLKSNYQYNTTDVPVPGKGQDYVAQFLFQSKRGYCNNFSSSLAIMLRTLGVPTRWATGYTSGTLNPTVSVDKSNVYVVTNNDAHSWVEVYFPRYGFIPFDPTPSFSIPFAQSATASTTPTSNGTTPAQTNTTTQSQSQTNTSSTSASSGSASSALRIFLYGILALALLVIVAYVAARNRVLLLRLERQWNRDPMKAFRRTSRLVTRALVHRSGTRGALTMRELWPVAQRVGIAEEDYRVWVLAAEKIYYGGERLSDEQAVELRKMSIAWLKSMYRETLSLSNVLNKVGRRTKRHQTGLSNKDGSQGST